MLLALGLCLFSLMGCQSKEEVIESEILEEETEETVAEETDEILEETEEIFIEPKDRGLVNIGVMKGPTGIGALGLTEEADRNYDYDLVVKTAPDELVALLSQGEIGRASCRERV